MIRFLIQSVLLGVGLAMDAFSVSIVNGLREPHMRRRKQVLIAGTFAFFQFFMPVIGWFCVRSITAEFRAFQHLVPWIALLLLLYAPPLLGISERMFGGFLYQLSQFILVMDFL